MPRRMTRRLTLDDNQAAFLAALEEQDPEAENWTAHWGVARLSVLGADPIGASYEGSYSVMKELIRRKLVDREQEGRLSHETGVVLNDTGREALKLHREKKS